MTIYCPFCGAALECPEPAPERAICYRCETEFSPRQILATAVRPEEPLPAAPVAPGGPETPADAPLGDYRLDRTPLQRAGVAMVIAGFVVLSTAVFNHQPLALTLSVFVHIQQQAITAEDLERMDAGDMMKLMLPEIEVGVLVFYVLVGLFMLGSGIAGLLNRGRWFLLAATILSFLPGLCCCFPLLPVGFYAAYQLSKL